MWILQCYHYVKEMAQEGENLVKIRVHDLAVCQKVSPTYVMKVLSGEHYKRFG